MFPDVCHTQFYDKNKAKSFSLERWIFLKVCVFSNLLGVTELTLVLSEESQNSLWSVKNVT